MSTGGVVLLALLVTEPVRYIFQQGFGFSHLRCLGHFIYNIAQRVVVDMEAAKALLTNGSRIDYDALW